MLILRRSVALSVSAWVSTVVLLYDKDAVIERDFLRIARVEYRPHRTGFFPEFAMATGSSTRMLLLLLLQCIYVAAYWKYADPKAYPHIPDNGPQVSYTMMFQQHSRWLMLTWLPAQSTLYGRQHEELLSRSS